MHGFATVLGVSRISNLRSIFKKDVIIAHLWFDAGDLLAIREVYPLREGQFAKRRQDPNLVSLGAGLFADVKGLEVAALPDGPALSVPQLFMLPWCGG